TGDYIALLDGDDTWLPGKLRAQIDLLESRPDLGLVHGDMRVVDDRDRVIAGSFFDQHEIEDVEGDLLPVLLRFNTITTSALVVRGELKDRFHPIPDWALAQDWWLALRTAEVAGIGCIREPVADYRRHRGNLNQGRGGARRTKLYTAGLPLRHWMLTAG